MDRSTKRMALAGITAAVVLTAAVITGAVVLLRGGSTGAEHTVSELSLIHI